MGLNMIPLSLLDNQYIAQLSVIHYIDRVVLYSSSLIKHKSMRDGILRSLEEMTKVLKI